MKEKNYFMGVVWLNTVAMNSNYGVYTFVHFHTKVESRSTDLFKVGICYGFGIF